MDELATRPASSRSNAPQCRATRAVVPVATSEKNQLGQPVDVGGCADGRGRRHADSTGKERVDKSDQEIQELLRQDGQRQK